MDSAPPHPVDASNSSLIAGRGGHHATIRRGQPFVASGPAFLTSRGRYSTTSSDRAHAVMLRSLAPGSGRSIPRPRAGGSRHLYRRGTGARRDRHDPLCQHADQPRQLGYGDAGAAGDRRGSGAPRRRHRRDGRGRDGRRRARCSRADRRQLRGIAVGRRHRRAGAGQPAVWPAFAGPAPGGIAWVGTGDGAAVSVPPLLPAIAIAGLVNDRIIVGSMEPRGAVGEYDPARPTLVEFDQGSHSFVTCWPACPCTRHSRGLSGCRRRFRMKLFLYPERASCYGRQNGSGARSNGSPTGLIRS